MNTAIPLALLCAVLTSCAPVERRQADLHARADVAYRTGRGHHLAQRPEAARAAYQAALQALPTHAATRNALAALHAQSGQFDAAIAIWRELTVAPRMGEGPDRAYLFANLGHAHMLNGEHDMALAALEKACLLDPLSSRSWQLLGETLRALRQDERAARMLGQAEALRKHDLRADIAASGGASVAAIGQALQEKPVAQAYPGWGHSHLQVRADGMMELRRTPAQPEPGPTPASGNRTARLEIRNGNGIRGLARTMARQVDEMDLRVIRLSNQPGFTVRQTRIEYGAGHQAAARRLARRIGNAELRQVEDCAPADLRLVLGHDRANKAG